MSSPGEFVVEVKENLYYCMVCNCYFTSYDSVLDHLEEEYHTASVQECGNDILLIGPNHQYYCSICDRLISGYLNVYTHITGKKHINSYNAMEENPEDEEEDVEYEAYEEDQDFEEDC